MASPELPAWFLHLEEEDRTFVKRLVLASGSLKELAESYGVSYPTIRLRLDRLIERVRTFDALQTDDAFQAKIRLLVAEGDVSPKVGKELLRLHAAVGNGGKRNG